jgi:polyprenyl-phospho-N-acetylgalactosaminyl synthase
MDSENIQKNAVTAIIPAYNESATIANVISVLKSHRLISEVLVVDDGSTDSTTDIAQNAGARVIRTPENLGKAGAMALGVKEAKTNIIFFSDADISGLTEEMVTKIVEPVLSGSYDMYVAIRDRKKLALNGIMPFLPILGGERSLTKNVWNLVPPVYKKGFQIEIAMNYFVKKSGGKMGAEILPGLGQVIKEKKRGFWKGLYARMLMIIDILIISCKLYIFERPKVKTSYVRI